MKLFKPFKFFLIVLTCGMFAPPLYSMDVKAEFIQADSHYMNGAEPEEALQLYRAIIANGQDEHYITLSKLKIAFILDKQSMQYEGAIKAYQVFLDDYPGSRLAKLVSGNIQNLQMIRDRGALEDYRKFKTAEKHYLTLTQKQGAGKSSTRNASLKLYEYAKKNYNQAFNEDMIRGTLSALVHQQRFFRAQGIIHLVDKKIPRIKGTADAYRSVVKVNLKREIITMAAETYIGLCVIFILIKKGYKQLVPVIRRRKLFLSIMTTSVFLYLYLNYKFIVIPDLETTFDLTSLFFIYGQSLVLILLSVSLYGAFSSFKSSWFKTVTLWMSCGLLGVSSWVIFAYHFDYLWLLGL